MVLNSIFIQINVTVNTLKYSESFSYTRQHLVCKQRKRMAGVIRYWSRMNLKFSGLSNALFRGNAAKMLALSSIGTRYRKRTVNEHNMILITGCDSGVGFVQINDPFLKIFIFFQNFN